MVGMKLDYSTWKVSSGWDKILQGDKLLLDKLQNQKAAILDQYPDNKNVMDAYTPPPDGTLTTDKAFLKCFIGKSVQWRAEYEAPTPQSIISMMSKGGQKMTFYLDSSKTSSEMSKSWAGADASFNDFFFGIYTNGSWKKLDLNEGGQRVTLTITFNKIDSFTVRPGDWYDGGYLANLKKQNQWAPGYSAEKVFGNNGLLPLVTTSFIACIGMSISVTISQTSYKMHQEEFNTAGGVRIGPFRFGGGSGGHSSDKWNKKAVDSTFTVNLTDQYPYIIGYKVARADGEQLYQGDIRAHKCN